MIISANEQQTRQVAADWAAECRGGEVFALIGVLGAGKTQLVKGLAEGLGTREEVTSPTYTLMHEYTGGRLPLYHLDVYRLAGPDDALRLGLDEYLPSRDGVTVIEWPERIEGLLPDCTRRYEIVVAGLNERLIREPGS